MKTIIVYYSLEGNTKQTAEKIAKLTGADLLALHPVKSYPDSGAKKFLWGGKSAVMGEKPKLQPYIFNAEKYDTVIFGTPVWASTFTPPLRTFIDENRDKLSNKQFAAFMCYMGGGANKAFAKLKKFLAVETLAAELVLTEPKASADEQNEEKIKAFCDSLKEIQA